MGEAVEGKRERKKKERKKKKEKREIWVRLWKERSACVLLCFIRADVNAV
jgi:hypothetical protein